MPNQLALPTITIAAVLSSGAIACQPEPSSPSPTPTTAEDDGDPSDDEAEADDVEADDDNGELTLECGDGQVDDSEECDDGNDDNKDACSNLCMLAACGDGIVQAGRGETCDDGNTIGGDGCAAACLRPGSIVWERMYELPEAAGTAVAVGHDGSIAVLAEAPDSTHFVLGLNPDGEVAWMSETGFDAVAIEPVADGGFVVGGVEAGQGQLRRYAANGEEEWTSSFKGVPKSTLTDLSVHPDGTTTSVGSALGKGMLIHHDELGDQVRIHEVPGTTELDAVAVLDDGSTYILARSPRQLSRHHQAGEPPWTLDMLPLGDEYADMAVDGSDAVILAGDANGAEGFGIARYTHDGIHAWTEVHDVPDFLESARGVAVLSFGDVVVASFTRTHGDNSQPYGLLSRYTIDGTFVADRWFLGDEEFHAITAAPDGSVVVTGQHQPGGEESRLWVMKVAF